MEGLTLTTPNVESNWTYTPQQRKTSTPPSSSPKLLHSPTLGFTRRATLSSIRNVKSGTTSTAAATNSNKIRKRKKMADSEKEEAINLVSFYLFFRLILIKII